MKSLEARDKNTLLLLWLILKKTKITKNNPVFQLIHLIAFGHHM